MDIINQNENYFFNFDLIKKSLIDLERMNKSNSNLNINKILSFLKKIENFYNIIFIEKKNSFHFFKRNIIFFEKSVIKMKDIKFKKNIYYNNVQDNSLLCLIILILKKFTENKNHNGIRKMLLILIKFITEKILSYDLFTMIIELILIILINILKSNEDTLFYINDEPFNFINDIIIALISYPNEIKIENSDPHLLTKIINLFDKYLFFQCHTNMILTETSVWLKLLENKFFIPINHIETSNYINDSSINKKIEVQKKLYSFLIKIYKFSMRNDYLENIIIKNSILDLNYYLNALNFLTQLFLEEIKSIPLYDFKIKDGIFIPKNKYIFFENIKPKSKIKEISIIFSFKIIKIEIDKIIDILEVFYNKKKSILKLYINEKGFLSLEQSENIKLETEIKIQENFCYFLCATIFKGSEVNFYMNGEDKIYYKKLNNFDLSKEFSLALGKNNFFGVMGELLIINKSISNKKINHLFTLKEDYANNLRKIYYDFKMFPKRIKLKYKIGYYNSDDMIKSIEVFKQLGFEIIFEIHPNDILYSKSKNKYLDIDNKNYLVNKDIIINDTINSPKKPEIKTNDFDINNNDILNVKENLLNNKDLRLFKNISKMHYSYDIFYQSNGIDFLTFQLYNIFSKINDNKLLNFYLYETLSFIMKLFSNYEKNFKYPTLETNKLEPEMISFFLALITCLSNKKGKKEKFYLDNKMILIFIEICEYFKENKLINEINLILSILLDIDFYKNKEYIFQYQQLFNLLKTELTENKNNNKNIINKDFLYKILILDFCFEKKEMKHKFLMEIISEFITFDERNRQENINLFVSIHNEFIKYFLSLKSEKKIYHYLKIIYINIDVIKDSLKNNSGEIIQAKENINYKHCKYCAYNQVLYYLIEKELFNINNESDKIFVFSPIGIDVNPSFLFLKCFFSQLFDLSNKDRIKFIKMNSDPIDYILELMKQNNNVFNFGKFPQKFENIIDYIKFLIYQIDSKDTNLLEKIIFSFKFILNLLRKITQNEINIINNKENNVDTKQKNDLDSEEKNKNLQIILEQENIKNFFDIYLMLNYNQAIEDLNYFVNISINKVFSPFYFGFLAKKSIYNTNNILKADKYRLITIIINEFIKQKINLDTNNDAIIIQNNIAFLIYIYNLFVNNTEEIDPDLESILLLFLNHLKIINIYNSKYVFDVNLKLDNNNNQKQNEKKFILEMVSDIYFHLYENKKYDMRYQCLIRDIFAEINILDIFKIDAQYFLEDKNKDKEYIFYNENYLSIILKGEERQDTIFSVYFIEYLLKKFESFQNIPKSKINSDDNPNNFTEEIMLFLLNKAIQLFYQYNKKISNSIKNFQKKNIYKSYTDLLEYIKNKYKSKNFSLDKLIEHCKKSRQIKKQNFQEKVKENI